MPGRGTQQDLRNFEAISLRLEPLAMVNAEILLATKNWAERTRSAPSLTAALVKSRLGADVCSWREAGTRENTHRTVASIATNPSRPNYESDYGQRSSARISLSIFVRVTAARREASSACARQKKGHTRCLTLRISPARSPIMMQGAIVLPVVTRGIMEPSAIRRLSIPWTLREPSTTDIASCPILAVHV
jgi:hypothetical protein